MLTADTDMAPSFVILLREFTATLVAAVIAAALAYKGRNVLESWSDRWAGKPVSQRAGRAILTFFIVAYVAVFATLSVRQHVNFHTHNDLAIHAQVVWNTSQGRWFQTTLLEDRPTNYLGHHFSPALLLLTPVYYLWPDAAVLLILQTVVLALGAIPVFLYTRGQTGSQILSLALSTAYLLFPALGYVNLFDFHEIVLSVPLLSFAAYCLLNRRDRLFFVLLGLCLLVKEEIALVGVAFALHILLVQKRYRFGFAVLLVSMAWGYLTMRLVMPAIAGDAYFPTGRYEYLGGDFGQMALSLLRHPLMVLQHLLISEKLVFLLLLLVPVGFLPLLGGETFIFAVPTLGYLLLSDYEPQYSIHYHYTAPLIPLLFIASVSGANRLIRWRGPQVTVAVSVLILVASLTGYFLYSPGPLARHFNEDGQYDLWLHLDSGYNALAAIPDNTPVMTIEEFAPHLAARESIYIENENNLPVEYILQEITARTATPRYPAFLPPGHELSYPLYETVFDKDGYWVRRYHDTVPLSNQAGISFDDKLTLLAYDWRDANGLSDAVLAPDAHLDLVIAWRAEQQLVEPYVFFVHLLDQSSHRWAQVDQEVERGVYPTTLWDSGMVVMDHYRLTIPWGTPPGEYAVLTGVYSRDDGQRLPPTHAQDALPDKALALATIQVTKPTSTPPLDEVSPQHRLDIQPIDGLELMGFDLGSTAARPGDTLSLILVWRATADVDEDYVVSLLLCHADGESQSIWSGEPTAGFYPTSRWQSGEIVRDWRDLTLTPDTPPGSYRLLLRLLSETGEPVGPDVSLGTLEVEGRHRVFTVPEIANPTEVRLGERIALLGYDLSPPPYTLGQSFSLTLYWQTLREVDASYTVFTHLLDSSEHIWGQKDSVPGSGSLPTTSWVEGEVVTDQYEIMIDPKAPPGQYVIEIGMYDANTGQRLPIVSDDQTMEDDRLLLATVEITPGE